MSATGFKGVDVRQTGAELVFRASLKGADGSKVTAGTTSLYLYEVQSDGTLKSYDFSDNAFKTTALTTETVSMAHRTGNNGTTSTGIWTYALATLTGFTAGAVYLAVASNTSAFPAQQEREFQYGSYQGDLVTTSTGTGTAAVTSLIGAGLAHGDTGGHNTTLALANNSSTVAPFTVSNINAAGPAALFSGYNGDVTVALVDQNGNGFVARTNIGTGIVALAGSSAVYLANGDDGITIVAGTDGHGIDILSNGTGKSVYLDGSGTIVNGATGGAIGKVDLATWLGSAPLALSAQQVQAVVPSSTVVASVTGAVGSVTAGVTVTTNNDKTGYALSASGLDAVLVESGISASANLVNDAATQLTSINARQALAAIMATTFGQLSGGGTTTETLKAGGKSTVTRAVATVDSSGNRSAIVGTLPT